MRNLQCVMMAETEYEAYVLSCGRERTRRHIELFYSGRPLTHYKSPHTYDGPVRVPVEGAVQVAHPLLEAWPAYPYRGKRLARRNGMQDPT